MNREIELFNRIEAYLMGELSPEDKAIFENQRQENPAFDNKVVEHQNFIQHLTEFGDRRKLSSNMDAIYENLDIESIKEEVMPPSLRVKKLWFKYRINTAIAATIALIIVFGTLLSTGYFSKEATTDYRALRRINREINSIKQSQNAIVRNVNSKLAKGPIDPGRFGGTGFAISSKGYLVTNYHVIDGADSIYVQNSIGESYKVKTVYKDQVNDIAVLQIIDSDFTSLGTLPYIFKREATDLGERIYTLGFPRDETEPIYGEGYLSSRTGYDGDTVAYQVSIPINYGNSGGPLLDNRGNIIGIIKGIQINANGAAFAIKSRFLFEALEAIPADSLEDELVLNKRNGLIGLSRPDQIKKIEEYVFNVKVY